MYDSLAKSDIEKMEEEIEYRKLMARKEAPEAVREARTHRDLSENFEYKAAKQDKNRDKGHICYLEKMIKTARIISNQSEVDEIELEDQMNVYIPDDDETEEYKSVITIRGNPLQGLISIDSPSGKAIRGHKVGERIHVKMDNCFGYEVEIRSINKIAADEDSRLCSF